MLCGPQGMARQPCSIELDVQLFSATRSEGGWLGFRPLLVSSAATAQTISTAKISRGGLCRSLKLVYKSELYPDSKFS